MFNLKRGQQPIFLFNMAAIIIFSAIFISRLNLEFMFYVAIIIFFLFVIVLTNHRVDYSLHVLWGLSLWALMHMSGGAVFIGGTRLYDIILIPLIGEPYLIFKYDQLVHIIGFGVATVAMYQLLKPSIGKGHWISLSIVIIMAGLGVGALNEIIEFVASVAVPESGVGGYYNTSLDLVSDLVGAIIAAIYLFLVEKPGTKYLKG
jgi:uncharacterized membrane protein YjdF